MYHKEISGLPLWQFNSLEKIPDLKHYVSGKPGGISQGVFSSLNLSYNVGDTNEFVDQNRRRIQDALQTSVLLFPYQTHSSNVIHIKTGLEDLHNADALVTNVPGICISVMSADCVPILLYDPVQKVIAAIHSGWRGTVAKIVDKTLDVMRDHYQSKPSTILACVGPSISQANYEVGGEVIAEVDAVFEKDAGVVERKAGGKGNLNLWEMNKMLLLKAGVNERNIEVAGICTYENSADFFSARKSGHKTGRFAAGIMLSH